MLNRPDSLLYRLSALIVISIICALPHGRSPPRAAAVSDRAQPPSRRIMTHEVSPGETLYSIAWRHGVDYRQLARHNNVSAPYTIYAGQILRLDVGTATVASAPSQSAARAPARPTRSPRATPAPTSTRSENRTASRATTPPPALVAGAPQWQWPARGRVMNAFAASTGFNQGIDSSWELCEPVIAAASGIVAYAGRGLRVS